MNDVTKEKIPKLNISQPRSQQVPKLVPAIPHSYLFPSLKSFGYSYIVEPIIGLAPQGQISCFLGEYWESHELP
ncbi:hypothetical protein EUGRSUZ_F03198 [Eucalyptus grandis]|uniref:Uncharacterized protein n=2 Tax=Eucalyptus grandis TaxID=71139 RepID=A0ACC3KKQ2_EUCGR|nr:hypothetical protein EUGRSUZ_F03198 [Eucalyptus grandis]